jgi:PRP38 family
MRCMQVGFLYLRYVCAPSSLQSWLEPYFADETVRSLHIFRLWKPLSGRACGLQIQNHHSCHCAASLPKACCGVEFLQ